ncbi:MAG: hypothetical protein KME56_00375 [Candidatus Thiodiazotropha sp. (ex Ctena orbiculata)]|nr:hypothetical protein [Candidatus Thiodiazotropha taylori]MBT2995076.1 hypothetical protein [Candidatus Thiodiazotropha taylori]MBT3000005.1 hypothetical protein [Candidatus Thiodiazotropha taylori]MBT3028024.1 hypothetical protein [Candidatus Thiodiazotropha taylori]MBT3035636.1 hypothetical protein [Candidatus Thiodiazotropha taylori]
MAGADQTRKWSIGWDVGGWNCDKNQNSRDAIVILDANHEIVGAPWRGNLRECINSCSTSIEWIAALFDLCGSGVSPESGPVILAIDTPLGFSEAYPSACKRSETIQALRQPYPVLSHADCEDALTCALVASLFAEKRGALKPPEADVSPSEGWIWVPRDAFAQDAASPDCT